METKGFTANIYRSQYDSYLNVLNGKNEVTIIDKELPAMNEPTDKAPAVRLVRRFIFGKDYIHAEPIKPGSYAFGGSFIFTSDSRFRDINNYPIPLHDRDMSLEAKHF